MNWYLRVIKKYAVFDGRARRVEYWMFFLINILFAIAIAFIDAVLRSGGVLGMLFIVATLLPGIGVTIRRLHDTDRAGAWILIGIIPLIGLVLIFFLIQDGTAGANRFGANPKEAAA